MERIFISYRRDDYAQAQKINDLLLNRPDIEPWLDSRRLRLVPFDAEIRSLIDGSSYVLALISQASLSGTGYVKDEWDYAIAKGKRRLPFLLDRSVENNPEAPAILAGIREINWARAYDSFEGAMRMVLREVYGDLAGQTFRETFSSLGPDNEGWRFGGWALEDVNAGNQNSQSIGAEVAPTFYAREQVRAATIAFALGQWSRIAYARKLMLNRAHLGAAARFQTSLSDGSHDLPIEDIALEGTQLKYDRDWEWVEQELDLTRFAGPERDAHLHAVRCGHASDATDEWELNVDNIRID